MAIKSYFSFYLHAILGVLQMGLLQMGYHPLLMLEMDCWLKQQSTITCVKPQVFLVVKH